MGRVDLEAMREAERHVAGNAYIRLPVAENVPMDASSIVAAIAAGIALAALYFTWRQVSAAEEQTALQRRIHEDAGQPYVWADIRPHAQHASFMMLVVKNDGPTVATSVSISIDPPFPSEWSRDGDNERFANNRRFASLPPGRVMQWNLGLPQNILPSPRSPVNEKGQFKITISFDGPYGPIDPLTYAIDLSEYRWVAKTTPGTPMSISKSVDDASRELSKAINKVAERIS
ncbi:hypothetical protein GOALK_029_00580 [Gordonia alkanivorans NBRC 16433]|uniref:Uncharacterized protein n=2 Tax=Gordonia alkanivorans TaxID=84096 RepID=F9VS14_9ACTN|nr:hypothetical protein GOALK_029_00580 [Gordonia alkanivorans NBRC 16433]